ncbi:MAG: NAD(P)-dependent oxidoreductase [Ignavibacteriales bacterium]|nr:NAD(P)-dependent oxidoreductase [Ignavibacteriales bacterium]
MKILITGAGGFFGQALLPELVRDHTVHAIYHNTPLFLPPCGFTVADIREGSALASIFSQFQPELVIHLAGITAVSHALAITEGDVKAINVTASGILAKLSQEYSAKIIYTSTDLVYSGDEGGMVKEEGKLNPLSLYASTKLEGETAVRGATDDYLILRLALMYGFSNGKVKSFFQEAYNKVKSGQKVVLFEDQYRSSLSVLDAAGMMKKLVTTEQNYKLLNFGSGERTSRAQLLPVLSKKPDLMKVFSKFAH